MIKKIITKHDGVFPIMSARAIDGDTIEANVCLPFGVVVTRRIRLKGWYADELKGLYAAAGEKAKARLQAFLNEHVVWIVTPTQRMDRYGRIVAHLLTMGQLVACKDVLGDLALTEAQHSARSDHARQKAAQRSAPPLAEGSGYP